MSRQDIEAGRASVKTWVDNSGLVKGLKAAKQHLQGLGTSVMGIGAGIMAMGASILAPLTAAVGVFADMGSELDDISNRTGVAASALAEYKYAAEQSGTGIEDFEKALIGLQKNGLDAANFDMYAAQIAAIEDPTERTKRAIELFGKAGQKIIPMLGELQELRQEARDLGLVPTEQAVKDAAKLGDTFDKIKSVALASIFEIGAALAPILLPGAEAVKNIAATVGRWVKENGQLVRTIAMIGAGLLAAGVAVTAIGAGIFGLGAVLGGAATVLSTLAAVASAVASPIGLTVAAIAGGVYAWTQFTESGRASVAFLMDLFGSLKTTAVDTFGGIVQALQAGDLMLAGQIAVKGLELAFMQGVAAISDLIGGQLGDTIGTIGQKFLGGDFAGAFQTALKQMLAWGASFAEGLVAIFTVAARAATDAWQGAVGKISDYLLETAAGGGVGGALVSKLLGVDVGAEAARTEQLDAQMRAKGMAVSGDGFVNDAKAAARDQIGGMADSFRDLLSGIDELMQDLTRDAESSLASDTAGGAAGANSRVAQLRAELDELRKQAAAAAEAAAAGGPSRPGVAGIAQQSDKMQNFASFSAAAFAAGAGVGIQERIARAAERQVEQNNQMLNKLDEQRRAMDAVAALGVVV